MAYLHAYFRPKANFLEYWPWVLDPRHICGYTTEAFVICIFYY